MENKGKRKVVVIKEEVKEEEEEISKLVLGIMEGYSDSVIPPLTLFKPSGLSESAMNIKRCKSSENVKERDRRIKMNDSYSLLESIVPGIVPKFYLDKNICNLSGNLPNHYSMSTKEMVIQGTIEYIKYLEEQMKMLEKLKESMLEERGPKRVSDLQMQSTTRNKNSSMSVTVCGRVGFFGIVSPKREGLVAQIFMVFQKHNTEVLAANVVANQGLLTLTVTALVNGGDDTSGTIEEIKREILVL